MKLDRLHEYLTTATAVVIGGLVSYWFGLLAGEGSIGTILAVFAGFLLCGLLLSLRSNVWMLIPVTWAFNGELIQVKLHPSLNHAVVASVLVTTFMLIAVKALRFRPKFRALDFWVAAMLLYILMAYVRHPTGGLVLQSDRIGGRAYLNTAVSVAAYYVLSRAVIPVHWKGTGFFFCIIAGELAQGALYAITHFRPGLGVSIARLYTGVETGDLLAGDYGPGPADEGTGRLIFIPYVTLPVLRGMLAWFSPRTLASILSPLPTFIFGSFVLISLLSGFRGGIVVTTVYFLLASYLKRGLGEALRFGALALCAILLLIASSYFITLPLSMQRALCFLPGRWDQTAVVEAQNSTEWRVYMWKLMLSSNRYIENKWLGDGFGFSMRQFELMAGDKSELAAQENFMIVGQVHSGPISAVRFVGYLGLALYLCLQIVMAREAWLLCRRTLHSPLSPLVFYLCLPIIWEPFTYSFIFGSFDIALPIQLYWAGLLKMLRNSVEAREAAAAEEMAPASRMVLPVRRPIFPGGKPLTVPLP